MMLLFLLLTLTTASGSDCPDQQRPEVQIPLGKIIGKRVDFEGISVHTFQSIPYAKPPIGDLRFKKPQPVDAWEEPIIVADRLPPGCVQYSSNHFPLLDDLPGKTMDCLYLNVWAPANAGPGNQRSVLFFMHGGGYRISSSRVDFFNGQALAALGDVVVVTTNVRLGVEGFLYSATEDAPGNMGLYDLLEALKWTNTYIEHFGGNKASVTYFGHSSGAISAGLLLTSPMADGLFARAIFQSGSAANRDGEDNERDFALSEGVAKAVGCTPGQRTLGEEPEAVVECLRGKDPLELAKTVGKVSDNPQRDFYPRYGDQILPRNAREQISRGRFRNVAILVGTNKNEGSTIITRANKDVFGFFGYKTDRVNRTVGEQIMRANFKAFRGVDAVVEHYLGSLSEDDEIEVLHQVQTAAADYARVCPSVYLAENFAANSNRVHYYEFTHPSSNAPWAPWMGVAHFEETPFVFGHPLRYPANYTEAEVELSRRMIGIWTKFAKSGNLENWPLYSQDQPNYKTLDVNDEKIGTGPDVNNCNFFRPYFGF